MNPYWGKSFFQFFPLFFVRLTKILTGNLSLSNLASDEIQIFVLALISITSALIGTFLVLKKMTMLANSLSHTILLGIVIAYLLLFSNSGEMKMNFRVLLIAALATGVLTTLCTQFIHHKIRLQLDASIGIVFTSLFALGIVLVTLYTRNTHIGLEVVMGNADALHFDDLKIAGLVASGSLLFVLLFYKELKLVCFDSALASTLGFRPALFNYLLMLLTSAAAISAFRAVGVLLFLAFLVGLPVIASLLSNNLHKILMLASIIGVLCSLVSVALARHFLSVYQMPLSTAGLSVSLIGCVFLLTALMQWAARRLTFTKI